MIINLPDDEPEEETIESLTEALSALMEVVRIQGVFLTHIIHTLEANGTSISNPFTRGESVH